MFTFAALALLIVPALCAHKASPEKIVYKTTTVQPTSRGVLHVTLSTSPTDKKLAEKAGSITIPFRVLQNQNVSRFLAATVEEEGEETAAKVTPEMPVNISGPVLKALKPLLIGVNALIPRNRNWFELSAAAKKVNLESIIKLVKGVHHHQLPELMEAAYYLDAQPLLDALAWRYAEYLHGHTNLIHEIIEKDNFHPSIYKNLAPLIARQFFLHYDFDIDQQLGLKKKITIPLEILLAYKKIPAPIFEFIPVETLEKDIDTTFVMNDPRPNPLTDPNIPFHAAHPGAYNGQTFSALSMVLTVTPRFTLFNLAKPARINALKALLKAGAHVNNPAAIAPLMRAAHTLSMSRQWKYNLNMAEAVRLLVEAGADVNVTDNFGRTPLMFAADTGHKPIVRLLIEHGADLRMRDQNRKTALDYAEGSRQKDVAEILKKHGAVHGHELRNPEEPD